jgi:hypothetical protein
MKDLTSLIKFSNAFGPVTLAADATAVVVDLRGYHSAVLDLGIGIGGITFDGSNYLEFTVQHSDDNVTYTDLVLADLNGVDKPASIVVGQNSASCIKRLIAAHAAAANYKMGYIGGKCYLRLDAEFTGTHGTGTPVHWKVILGDAELQKVD